MRGLRKSERRLLWLLFLAGFTVSNGILWREFRARMKKKEAQLAELQGELETNAAVLEERTYWETRGAWLDERMPRLEDRGASHARLLESLRATASAHDLDVDSVTLGKPAGTPFFEELAVTLQVDGPENQLYRWLAEMQSPELFQAVKFLKIYRDQQDDETPEPLNECRVTVAQWYQR